ncbi:MAG: ABC transporter ATP-binding protein/permease [Candidatus Bathyarchaeota archaeon]|nr:ABC transporter ATP-binding protein/permease [Candidatus Bathyarchaeota archaeon]
MEEKGRPRESTIKLIRRLLSFIARYKLRVAILLISASLSIILNLYAPYIGRLLIDQGIMAANVDNMVRYGVLLASIALAGWCAGVFRFYMLSWITQRLLYDLRKLMFEKSVHLDYGYFSSVEPGQIISRFTNDIDTVGETATSGLLDTLFNSLTIIGAIVAMTSINWKLTLAAFFMIPLIILTVITIAEKSRAAYRVVRSKVGELTSKVEESVSGIREAQSYSERRRVDIESFSRIGLEVMQANIRATKVIGLMNPLMNLIRGGAIAIIIVYGGYLVSTGEATIGSLVAFYSYLEMFFGPVTMIALFYNTFQSALAAAERIFGFIDAKPSVVEASDAVDIEIEKGRISLENVYFSYSDTPVFEDFNLEIKPGEILAVVGPTGAGKTTLANLILRLYDPQKGVVTIDGVDVRRVRIQSLRRQTALVPQEPILFEDTVIGNIRYGKQDASDEEIAEAIRMLGLEELIERLPEGLNTRVTEGGANLSVGQRQLINIARALIRNPKIVVLDEATSSVDPYTESLLQRALKKLLEGRTCIIIAHRLSTTFLADRVIVLDKGRIVEEGSHIELLRKGGVYAKLYEAQLGEAAKAIRTVIG